MTASPVSWAIALDGGTTNTRARLVDIAGGRVVATARRGAGVRDAVRARGETDRPLERAVREALEELGRASHGVVPELIVAAGMLSSEAGLAKVAHVAAPAGLYALAQGAVVCELPAVAALPIIFVPGVRTAAAAGPDGWAAADVMRGEECETLGAWLRLQETARLAPAAQAFLWPGSHTKLVEVDRSGRIMRSQTTLAGEMLEAVARHTLLAASLPEGLPDDPEPAAVLAGARQVERDGLGRAAFLVRLAALTDALEPAARAAFWLGAVVADDVAHLARHAILQARPTVWVGGRQPLRNLYARLLARQYDAPVRVLDDETAEAASALGAVAVAVALRGGSGLGGATCRDAPVTG